MAKNISLFPEINERLLAQIKIEKTQYCFFSEDKNELKLQVLNGSSDVFFVDDPNGNFDPSKNMLEATRNYAITYASYLFGSQGIVCKNAKLGFAVMWKSQNSRQRNVVPIGEIKNQNETQKFTLSFSFPKNTLRGSVILSTVMYVMEAGNASVDEAFLANTKGFVLGEIDSFKLQLDGRGSEFPIFEVSLPGKPLWHTNCTWEDATMDLLEDSFAIYINTAHSDYKYIDYKSKDFLEGMLKEVMASALCTLILRVKENQDEWIAATTGTNIEEGSVCAAVYYFLQTNQWDTEHPELLSLSIRQFFEKKEIKK